MKNFVKLLLFFCFLIVNESKAQNNDLYILKLKSGLTIKCELVKVVPDSFVSIRQYGLESKVNMSDVVNITYSESLFSTNTFKSKVKPVKKNLLDTGWSLGLQPGFTIGSGGDWGVTSSFTFRASMLNSNGKNTMYGFNFGFDPYDFYGTILAPTTLEGRYYIGKPAPARVFFNGNIGYSWNLLSPRTGNDGGLTFGFGVGKSYRLRSGNVFSYQFGYKSQDFKQENFIWWRNETVYQIISARRIEFKLEWRY